MIKISYQKAEEILGGRADRRRAYYFCNDPETMKYLCGGPIFKYGEWTESCSGCRETSCGQNVGEYPWDDKAKCYVGVGCSECGYTGKRRNGWYCPVEIKKN